MSIKKLRELIMSQGKREKSGMKLAQLVRAYEQRTGELAPAWFMGK